MLYGVSLTKDAERDLEEIYLYLSEHDSPASADHVLARLIAEVFTETARTHERDQTRWKSTTGVV